MLTATKPDQAWSYSALNKFETCPRQYYETKIAKNFSDVQASQGAGQDFHHAAEATLKTGDPLPSHLRRYTPVVATVQQAVTKPGTTLAVEQKMALDKSLQPVPYFDKSVWVRAVADFVVTAPSGTSAVAGDWKTGKERPASSQLMLTAAVLFATRPKLEKVVTSFVWLQTGNVTREWFNRAAIPNIWKHFNPRVLRLQKAIDTGDFPPRPSGLCRNHCTVTSCPLNGHYEPVP